VPRAPWCRPEIYDLFDRWRRTCLAENGALFSEGGEPVWTSTNLRELQSTFATELTGGGSFFGKLRRQLEPHPPAVRQLGVEIAYLEYIGERDTSGHTKRTNLGALGDLLPEGVAIPAHLAEILDGGIASYGPGKQYRDAYVRFLLKLARHAKTELVRSGSVVLEDPWRFRDLVAEARTSTDGLEANAVLHGCFPEQFDVMISGGHRAKLLRTFEQEPAVSGAVDDDHKLLAIRKLLLERMPVPIDNPYDERVRPVWDGGDAAEWRELTERAVSALPSIEIEGSAADSAGLPPVDVDLLERMQRLLGGSVEGASWDELLLQVSAHVVARGGDARSWPRVLAALSDAVAGLDAALEPAVVTAERPLTLRAVSANLASELLMPQSWLQRTVDLLTERRQMVLYGPPGTGKTFLARRLARYVCAQPEDLRVIQFHPSYSYEDFVEGYRPRVAQDGALTYELVKGPLRELSDRAQINPDRPHVLLIDEINRGNMAKIFGELYFLLEYRDEPLRLQYSSHEEFRLPPNLFVMGTMNTADRSIALLDAALRRRFSFVELTPNAPPVAGLLEQWLRRNGLDPEPAVLLDTLNALLVEADGDTDLAIGPSYFMNRQRAVPDLESIWRHELMPLIEERFHGSGRDVAGQFGLGRVQAESSRRADRSAEAEPPTD